MTRLSSLIILFAITLNPISAQKRIEINNQTPGWLSSLITYPQQQEVEEIKVSGYINQLDINFLKDLTCQSLTSIDLYDANIVKYDKYPANTLTEDFFDRFTVLHEYKTINKLILPRTIETVEKEALDGLLVDTLYIGYKNITTPLPDASYNVKHIVLMEGVENITHAKITNMGYSPSYYNVYTKIISKIPNTIKEIVDLTTLDTYYNPIIDTRYLTQGFNIPENAVRIGTKVRAALYRYGNSASDSLQKIVTPKSYAIPSTCEILNLGSYLISVDTLTVPEKTEYISAIFDVKYLICLSKNPPKIDRQSYRNTNTKEDYTSHIDTVFCPKGCLAAYKKAFGNVFELPTMVESISLNTNALKLYVDESTKLTAEYAPADAENTNFAWSSSDTSIATVDSRGNVKGLKPGKVTITVKSSNNITATCEVEVIKHVESITLSPNETTINTLGESVTLTPQILPEDAFDKSIIWESSSPNICHVSETGVVTTLGYGIAIITASTKDGGYKAYCKIIVEKGSVNVSSIILDKSELLLTKGKEYALSATVLPNDADNKALTWSSTNPTVATVNNLGVISALSEGEATIIAQAADGSGTIATCNVKVEKEFVYISSMTFNPASITLKNGDTQSLNITIIPDSSTNKKLTWSSTDNSVLTVDNEGTVTALSTGHAMVIATTTDGSNISAICDVTVDEMNALSSIKSDDGIKIYANNGTIIIEGNIVDKDIFIYSLDGRIIHQSTADTMRIEIPLNSKGIYAVKIGEKVAKLAVR